MGRIRQLDPGHQGVRTVLRLFGPLVALTGLIFIVVGMVDFFSAAGSHHAPTKFWCLFVGMPVLFVGLVLSKFAFLGRIGRYMAGEMAPVAKDTINYMAAGTRESVREIAGAIGEGLRGEGTGPGIRCPGCGDENQGDANFCSNCGKKLPRRQVCPACGEGNDRDARFCDHCGHGLG